MTNDVDMLKFNVEFTPLPLPPGRIPLEQRTASIPIRITPKAKQPKLPRKLKKRMQRLGYRIKFEIQRNDSDAVWKHFAHWHKIAGG